uniref:Uncharacterized protein n=1 Tax=Panagrolaimus sp. PS1159 TaxID=55785 RepID=A0AC35FBB3_9BILA
MPQHHSSKLKENHQRSLQHQRHVSKLEKDIKYAQSDEEKAKMYDKFAENYLMPKELWIKRLRFVSERELDGYKEVSRRLLVDRRNTAEQIQVLQNAIQHLYYDREAINCKSIYLKVLKPSVENFDLPGNADTMLVSKSFVNKSLDQLSYPNHRLRHNLMLYQRCSSSPPPKSLIEKVERMEKLYWRIKAASGNLEKWIKIMAETNDAEFVKHNIEFKLGNDLTNKKLWRLYIDYLRKNDRKEMLQVYSKYCRYFLEDTKMKEEYQRETEKMEEIVFVQWKNPFEFETIPPCSMKFDESNISEKQWLRETESFERYTPFRCPKIDLNVTPQDWSLPSPIIRYIISNANPTIYQKLQQSCKYFFFKNPLLFCYRFFFTDFHLDSVQFIESSAECTTSSISTFRHKDLHITTVLNFYDRMSKTSLSKVIQEKFFQCDAKFIDICDQDFSEKEFKFLVGHGNVEKIELWDCEILKENGQLMVTEEILALLPKIRSFT